MFVLMVRILVFIILFSQFTYGQLTLKQQNRFDSLFAYAQNSDFDKESRLKTFAKAAQVVYKDLDYGLEISDAYLKYSKKVNSPNHTANALDRLGYALMIKGNTSWSRRYSDEMLQIANETNNPKLMCRAFASLGNLKQHQGELDSALFFQKKSLALTRDHGFKIFESRALLNIGSIEKELGHYRESLEALIKAREIIEQQRANGYYTSIYNELGDLYTLINEYTPARIYYNKALNTAISKNNHWKRVETLGKIADLLMLQDSVAIANKYLINGLNISYVQNISPGKSTVLLGLAKISFAQGEHRAAVDSLKKAISLMIDNNLQQGIEEHYLWLGKGLSELQLYDESILALKKAYDISLNLNNEKVLRESSYQLYKIYKKLEKFKISMKYLEEFNNLESIRNDEQILKDLLSYELKSNFEKKSFEDSLLNIQKIERINEEHLKTSKFNNLRFNFALITLGVLIILFVLLYRNYRSKKKQSILLEERKAEVENALENIQMLHKELQHRVKNNMQIASSLLNQRARHTENDASKSALIESRLRLQSMLLAYQKLYGSGNLDTIELVDYLKDLLEELNNALLPENCTYTIDGEELKVNIEQAQTVGFIIHELIANSCKYAWNKNDLPKINIEVITLGDTINLKYSDNGKGISNDIPIEQRTSFGLKLVHSLVTRQLPGKITTWNDNGAHFSIKFKKR